MKALNLYTLIPLQNKLLKFSKAIKARAFYKDHYVDLLTGESWASNVEAWISTLDFKVHAHTENKRFIHLFYELGIFFESKKIELHSDELLAIDIQYNHVEEIELFKSNQKIELVPKSTPSFEDYRKKFMDGYRELSLGNCYQFNLTDEFTYSFSENLNPHDFIAKLWKDSKKRGAYASATYVEAFEKLFLSNSPECLFQYHGSELLARPIKGTLKRKSDDKGEIDLLWKELKSDPKSQGELYMITDLLRNDLSRIDLPQAVVTKKKALLLVPGLIHQYSEIKVKLREHVTLKNILEKVFPGGSITGTPKKRTIEILRRIENRTRGFYCGSTLVFSQGKIEASINIRSSVIDFKMHTLSYQAGGGITLMSEVKSEFLEMTYKHDSYIDVLTL